MSQGERNCPFLMFTARLVFPAAISKSVCRERNAGICSTSQTFAARDQVGPEIVYFSDCIVTGQEPEPSGVEGWIDQQIMDALKKSIAEYRPVQVGPFEKKSRPDLNQRIDRRP